MPLYEFVCKACGATHTATTNNPRACHVCDEMMKRRFSFAFNKPMPEHFNRSVGKYVSNEQKFKDELKRKSEDAEARTGIPHNYVPVDPTDKVGLGVTDEGLTV